MVKRLIFKCFLFVALLALLLIPYHYLLDEQSSPFWGNEILPQKIQAIEYSDFNTFFFGSSVTFHGVKPKLFDRLSGNKIRSFNLATDGSLFCESHYQVTKFLESKDNFPDSTFFFFELRPIVKLRPEKIHIIRSNYFLDYNRFRYLMSYYFETQDFMEIKKTMVLFLKKVFKIGHILSQVDSLLHKRSNLKKKIQSTSGYQSYRKKDGTYISHQTKRVREKFLNDDPNQKLLNQKNAIHKEGILEDQKFSRTQLRMVHELISLCDKKNVNIIFIKPPKLTKLKSLFSQIGQHHKIDLSSPSTFPELYDFDYSFNIGHFNDSGARKYTEFIAREFMKLRMQKKSIAND